MPAGPSLRPDDAELIGSSISQFKILEKLGEGPGGTTYLGEHTTIHTKVAVKVLHEAARLDPSRVEGFYADLKTVNLLGHENIASLLDRRPLKNGVHVVVTELLAGRSLVTLRGAPLEQVAVVSVLKQLCGALQACHAKGVLHGDLRAENVMLSRRLSHEHFVKLLDFGGWRLLAPANERLASGQLRVNDCYSLAPEQWAGDQVDARTDVYALGVLAYLMATGRFPFEGELATMLAAAHCDQAVVAPRQLAPGMTEPLERVILKALSKAPHERYRTVADLREALEGTIVVEAAPLPAASARSLTHFRANPRQKVELSKGWAVKASWKGQELLDMVAEDLTRGGMFLRHEGELPAAFSRIKISITSPQGAIDCEADVVQHVTQEQAASWKMSSGFAVQFVNPTAQFKGLIDRLVSGVAPDPVAQANSETPLAKGDQDRLASYTAKLLIDDPYELLGMPLDAEGSDLRSRGRVMLRDIEGLKQKVPDQARALEQVAERINKSVNILGTPATRVEFDADISNFRGVARTISAGLPLEELAEARKRYLVLHPGLDGKSTLALITASSLASSGQLLLALERFEQALSADPLNLQLQQKYWTFKRQSSRK